MDAICTVSLVKMIGWVVIFSMIIILLWFRKCLVAHFKYIRVDFGALENELSTRDVFDVGLYREVSDVDDILNEYISSSVIESNTRALKKIREGLNEKKYDYMNRTMV